MQAQISLDRARHALCFCTKTKQTHLHSHDRTQQGLLASRAVDFDLSLLETACSSTKACIGHNQEGFRGLLATQHLCRGDVVASVPLHNVLQVPRQLGTREALAAAEAAVASWQEHHGMLPAELQDLILDADCPWEAKLVYWLLHLKATAAPGTFWHTYCKAMPSQKETLSFFCYSEHQTEQLQYSTWKALAAKQRELLHDVLQRGQQLYNSSSSSQNRGNTSSNNSSSTSSGKAVQQPTQQEVTWALTMVKSRTFGRPLQQHTSKAHHDPAAGSPDNADATHKGSRNSAETAVVEGQGSLEQDSQQAELDGSDDDPVVLLMVPFVDMVNHSQQYNCSFGVNWSTNCFEITSNSNLTQGAEVTISYGSNKSSLALLSSYGFFIPGNRSDAQLLQPIFKSCLSVAADIRGFEPSVISAATRQRVLEIQGVGCDMSDSEHAVQLVRVETAASALPVDASKPAARGSKSPGSSSQEKLWAQKYLAELISYQVQQMAKLCGTSLEEDASLMQSLRVPHRRDDNRGSLEQAIHLQSVAARIEQKLVLMECHALCQRIMKLMAGALQAS